MLTALAPLELSVDLGARRDRLALIKGVCHHVWLPFLFLKTHCKTEMWLLILTEPERRKPQSFHREGQAQEGWSFPHVASSSGFFAISTSCGRTRLPRVSRGLGGNVCGLPPAVPGSVSSELSLGGSR